MTLSRCCRLIFRYCSSIGVSLPRLPDLERGAGSSSSSSAPSTASCSASSTFMLSIERPSLSAYLRWRASFSFRCSAVSSSSACDLEKRNLDVLSKPPSVVESSPSFCLLLVGSGWTSSPCSTAGCRGGCGLGRFSGRGGGRGKEGVALKKLDMVRCLAG